MSIAFVLLQFRFSTTGWTTMSLKKHTSKVSQVSLIYFVVAGMQMFLLQMNSIKT